MKRVKKQMKWLSLVTMMIVLCVLVASNPVIARGPGGGGGDMGGGGIIDPPPGLDFRDPPLLEDVNPDSTIFEGNLDARMANISVNGTNATLYTYNGLYPGPMIKVSRGQTLKINFTNSLPDIGGTNILGFPLNHTNIHTHGLHVSPEEPADAAHLDVAPGQGYNYIYDLSLVDPSALYIVHPHKHGLVAEQYFGGMISTIQVTDEVTTLSAFETKRHTIILKDISLSGNGPAAHSSMMDFMHGKEGSIITVNGLINPVLKIKPGEVQRWQILNGSNARFYKLSLENHTMYLIGTDAGLLDKPYAVSYLLLSPGERVDVLVKANRTIGNYRLLSLPYSRQGMMTSDQVTLMTLADGGARVTDSIPAVIDPDAARLNIDTTMLPHRTLVLSMGQGRGYINGMDFDVEPYTIMSEVGTDMMPSYEVWEIINQSGMDHPFHQHVNAAQVLSVTGGDAGYASLYTGIPAMKDVVIVPKWGSIKLLVPILDYTGMTMFHCHIVEHEDIGMMGMWHLMPMSMPMP